MVITIQQWRAAIGRPAPHLKVLKEDEEVRSKVVDAGRRLLARIFVAILWMLLANRLMSFCENVSTDEQEVRLCLSGAKEAMRLDTERPLEVIKVLLLLRAILELK